jgi:two-component system, OmpR family, response regulator
MDKAVLTTYDVSRLINVDISTVSDWIDGKKLAAYRTPGGHRRVRREDLLAFMKAHGMPAAEPPPAPAVLIVEDDVDFRRALRRMVESLPGVAVHEAEDGFTAGRKLGEVKPDVVLLDLMLPGVDGFKVCRQIRRDPHLENTRVIVVSGHDTPESRRKVQEAGADAFLAKPLGLARLKESIMSLLTRPAGAGASK